MNSSKVIKRNTEWEDLGDGISRQLMGWDNKIMMVKVKFKKGAVGAEHKHPHVQTTYCVSGKFEFTIDGEGVIIEPGDGLYVAPDLLHGALCLEPGILIDVFSPAREDFLKA